MAYTPTSPDSWIPTSPEPGPDRGKEAPEKGDPETKEDLKKLRASMDRVEKQQEIHEKISLPNLQKLMEVNPWDNGTSQLDQFLNKAGLPAFAYKTIDEFKTIPFQKQREEIGKLERAAHEMGYWGLEYQSQKYHENYNGTDNYQERLKTAEKSGRMPLTGVLSNQLTGYIGSVTAETGKEGPQLTNTQRRFQENIRVINKALGKLGRNGIATDKFLDAPKWKQDQYIRRLGWLLRKNGYKEVRPGETELTEAMLSAINDIANSTPDQTTDAA